MSKNRGIFESFPSQPAKGQDSPFTVASESTGDKSEDPAAAAVRKDSPFTVVDEAAESMRAERETPTKSPDSRKAESPFQVADPAEGFGFEASAQTPPASPFATPVTPEPESSPFSSSPDPAQASPFGTEAKTPASASTHAAIAAFSEWQEPAAAAVEPAAVAPQAQVPSAFTPASKPVEPAPQVQKEQAPSPAPAAAPAPVAAPAPPSMDESQSDSFSIRQLELRAIFGMDREMTAEEILQRTRALPGMRNVARVTAKDMAAIESLKGLLPSLGFGSGALKLYSGSVPLEFVREGPVLLAVQTDGGFAPGVRETLMIVARELKRLN